MKSKLVKIIVALVVIGLIYVGYMWFMPHRDIQSTKAFKTIGATALVNEFLTDKESANQLYLDTEGESKVLIVSGTIAAISTDQLGQQVILLKDSDEKMGVSCTFTLETNAQTSNLAQGSNIRVKGVLRSGAEYDEDLVLTENVILEKCSIEK
tara:strand:- start:56256 stop:56714 length:459 start_codon:yes stop_codon:yes gene_type:complete